MFHNFSRFPSHHFLLFFQVWAGKKLLVTLDEDVKAQHDWYHVLFVLGTGTCCVRSHGWWKKLHPLHHPWVVPGEISHGHHGTRWKLCSTPSRKGGQQFWDFETCPNQGAHVFFWIWMSMDKPWQTKSHNGQDFRIVFTAWRHQEGVVDQGKRLVCAISMDRTCSFLLGLGFHGD